MRIFVGVVDAVVINVKAKQPKVQGYLCLPTETFDDDGLPHTLEHLIFMGSKKYPYMGSLNFMAGACSASVVFLGAGAKEPIRFG